MRRILLVLTGLMFATTVVLLFLAGMGAFDIGPRAEAFAPHSALGRGLFVLAVLATVLAAVARMPGRVTGMAALVAGLVVVQALIAVVARALDDGGPDATAATVVFGLHAINGLVTMGVARMLFVRVRALVRPDRAAPAGHGATPAPAAP